MKFTGASRAWTSFRAFVKADAGATAVEMAMVGPPFFILFMAMFETGLMLFTEYSLQVSVQNTARKIRTGEAQNTGWSVNTFIQQVCDNVPIIKDCKKKLEVYVTSTSGTQNFSDLKASIPADISGSPNPEVAPKIKVYNPGSASCRTAVYVFYDWKFHIPFMSPFANKNNGVRRLKGYTIFRTEPYAIGAGGAAACP